MITSLFIGCKGMRQAGEAIPWLTVNEQLEKKVFRSVTSQGQHYNLQDRTGCGVERNSEALG